MIPVIPLAVAGVLAVVGFAMSRSKTEGSGGAAPELPPGIGDVPSGTVVTPDVPPNNAVPATPESAPAGALPPNSAPNTGDVAVAHADDAFDAAVAAAIAMGAVNVLEKLAAEAEAKGLLTVARSIRDEIARLKAASSTSAPTPVIPTKPGPDKPLPSTALATYIVLDGDTGEKVATKFTGNKSRWPELLTVNPTLKDAKFGIKLFTGHRINLPSSWPSGVPVINSPIPAVSLPAPAPAGVHTYRVLAGDTGEKVAAKFTGNKARWPELLKVNPKLKSAKFGISLFTGHDINIPLDWPALPTQVIVDIGPATIVPATAPTPAPASPLPPGGDKRTAAEELTRLLTNLGGLAGRGKESRPAVAALLSRLGVPDATGMYGRQGAGAIMQAGLVPVVPYYWPKTGWQKAKADFTGLVQNFKAADPQRASQWDKLIADIQRA